MDEYFEKIKKNLEQKIPSFDSSDFKKVGDKIRKELQKKENDYLILIRRLKILVLGDWYSKEKKQRLIDIKNMLLEHGLYAETIDKYYDLSKKGGLTPEQILETCCINHQLIVFLDGDGKGTITEQNYLSANYPLQGKVIFFIEEYKFNQMKDDPSKYLKSFPTIITYKEPELIHKVLVFSRFRIYRLAEIIELQSSRRKGLQNPNYHPWKRRLKNQ